MPCDLHLHSTASDGTDPPEALARLAARAGLAGIALTDHDTTAGVHACAEACAQHGIAFLAGIELSTNPDLEGNIIAEDAPAGSLHLLGYGIDPDNDTLLAVQRDVQNARTERNPQMIDRLNGLGVKITLDEVQQAAGGDVVGRPHVAQVMVAKGYVRSIHEAFSRYIGQGGAAYVRKDPIAAERAIDAIHAAGGVAVAAHPAHLQTQGKSGLERYLRKLVGMGLDGIETRHSDHSRDDIERFEKLAAQLELITTGGSDYHGSRKPIELGGITVPDRVMDRLRSQSQKPRA